MGPAVLLAVLSAVLGALRPAATAAAAAAIEERPASPAVATPCWREEQFVVAQECARCSEFQMKTLPDCAPTGFIERINCPTSQREEFKSCRSAALESRRFWRFVGSALAVAAAAAALVVLRQRELDRRAREKVRKQIESI
ncbi:protein JTB [Manacus candei]|uniref:protein JTB n=1 Tax=Manacus candei TaxID=415023 RepID=UPI002226613B|nr:protein JTB [Manacus candei]